MYKTLTLKNDFHNTEVDLRVKHDGKLEAWDAIELSVGQVKRAKRELCTQGCICSGATGARSQWHEIDGWAVQLGFQPNENPRTGKLESVTVWIERVAK
jgi:hypothetical protein